MFDFRDRAIADLLRDLRERRTVEIVAAGVLGGIVGAALTMRVMHRRERAPRRVDLVDVGERLRKYAPAPRALPAPSLAIARRGRR